MIRSNIAASLLSVLLLGMIAGCASSRSELQLTSTQTGDRFVNEMPVGVADVHENGVTDLVVKCHTTGEKVGCPPVDQLLHVRVLWKPGHAIKSQNLLVSENAALHWYITPSGHQESAGPAIVEYHGSGLVKVERDGDNVQIRIEHATLSPATVSGPMADRLGTTRLSGTLTARLDAEQTSAALGELRATLAASRSTAAEANLRGGQ